VFDASEEQQIDASVEPQAGGTHTAARKQMLRAPVLWGVVFGGMQAASPLGFWWLDPATVYALSLALIAAVYIGFAVADGRPAVVAVESGVAGVFVVLAAIGVTGPAWLLVVGLTAHGLKDLWQEHRHYVANTRWWPPFCLVVDWVAAAILVVLIATGVDFHHRRRRLTSHAPITHPFALPPRLTSEPSWRLMPHGWQAAVECGLGCR
jgi:hypothetical protein